MRFDTRRFRLRIVTPVHIGTGEEFEPVNYVIRDGHLCMIDRDRMIDDLRDEGLYDEFLEICSRTGSLALLRIREYIKRAYREEWSLDRIPVSPKVAHQYEDRVAAAVESDRPGRQIINQLLIKKAASDAWTLTPFIPGSSLKGAMRTAVLDEIVCSQPEKAHTGPVGRAAIDERGGRKSRLKEGVLLETKARDTSDDPFQALKVADCQLTEGGSTIGIAENVRSLDEEAAGQVIPVKMQMLAPGSELVGSLTLDTRAKVSKFGEDRVMTTEFLLRALRGHNRGAYEFERDRFHFSMPELESPGSALPIKLGMRTGAFAMSLDGFREGRVWNQGSKRMMDFQTKTWRCQNGVMGWVLLEEIGEAEFRHLMARAESRIEATRARLEENRRARRERLEAKRLAEEERLKEIRAQEEAEARALAEAEQIANLPPAEWVEAVIRDCDWDRLQQYLAEDSLAEDRKRALVLRWLSGTEEGKMKAKDWRKKQKKGKRLGATVQQIMEWAPDVFGQ